MVANRKAARRRLVAMMAKQGRGRDDMAAEIAGRERCGMLTAYRLLHDLSQEGAADRYNEALGVHIGDTGFLSRQRIGKLEAWPHSHICPTLPELVNLARLYGTEPQRLVRPDDLPKLLPSVRAALSPDDPAMVNGRTLESPTTRSGNEVDDMHRRELLNLVAAAGIGSTLPLGSVECLRDVVARAAGLPDSAQDWQTVAGQYASTVAATPPAQLLTDALTDLVDISRLLGAGHPERKALLDVSAQLSAYVAMALIELGQPRMAFRWWATARQSADATGRASLRAWVRAREGADLLYTAQMPARAQEVADEAVRLAGKQPSVGLAEAQVLRAGALARQGNPAARDALDDLSRTFESLPADVVVAGHTWAGFGEVRVREVEASANLWLRRATDARRATDRALALYPAGQTVPAAKTKLQAAAGMVLDGDVVDGITFAVDTLADLPFGLRTVRQRGGLVLDALPRKARALPAAGELRELVYA